MGLGLGIWGSEVRMGLSLMCPSPPNLTPQNSVRVTGRNCGVWGFTDLGDLGVRGEDGAELEMELRSLPPKSGSPERPLERWGGAVGLGFYGFGVLGFRGEEGALPCPSRAQQGASAPPVPPMLPPVPPGAPGPCQTRPRGSNSISRPHFPLRPGPDGLALIRLGREAPS